MVVIFYFYIIARATSRKTKLERLKVVIKQIDGGYRHTIDNLCYELFNGKNVKIALQVNIYP